MAGVRQGSKVECSHCCHCHRCYIALANKREKKKECRKKKKNGVVWGSVGGGETGRAAADVRASGCRGHRKGRGVGERPRSTGGVDSTAAGS